MKKFVLLSGILAFLGIPFANATVEVRVINVVGGVAVGDTGWIQCVGASCIFTGAVGNYDITSDITVQHTSSNPLLDLAYSASTTINSNPGTIIIEGMANGYAVNTPTLQLIDNGNSGFSTGTFTDAAYGGNNNNICASGPSLCWNGISNPAPSGTGSATIATGGPFTSPATWNVNQSGPGNSVNPYSLGLVVSLANATGLSTFSGDAKIDAVPEPTSVLLLGGVLLFAASGLRRRMRKA
jgi:hypothetical protein